MPWKCRTRVYKRRTACESNKKKKSKSLVLLIVSRPKQVTMGNHTSISSIEQAQPAHGLMCPLTDEQDSRFTECEEYRRKQSQSAVSSQPATRRPGSSRAFIRRSSPTSMKKQGTPYPKRNFFRRKKRVPARQPLTQTEKDFLAAAARGDLNVVQELLENGVGIETADANEMTALHHAAKNVREAVINYLVDRGANVNSSDLAGGFSPLHWVIINSSLQLCSVDHVDQSVIALARGGCDMNAKDFNLATPLHMAVQRANKTTIDTLVRLGANPLSVDVKGRNCFQMATRDDVREVMERMHMKKESIVYHVLEVPTATPSPPSTPPPRRKRLQHGSLLPVSRGSLSPTPPVDVTVLRTLPKFKRMPSPNYPAPPPPLYSTCPDYSVLECPIPRVSARQYPISMQFRPLPSLPMHVHSPLHHYKSSHSPPSPPPRVFVKRLSPPHSPSSSRPHKNCY